MNYKIIPTIVFAKELKLLKKKFPSIGDDIARLCNLLQKEPHTGMPLGFDCFKIRLAIKSKGKGKSGGGRVITCVKISGQKIYLISVYDKSEQDSIRDKLLIHYLKLSGLL